LLDAEPKTPRRRQGFGLSEMSESGSGEHKNLGKTALLPAQQPHVTELDSAIRIDFKNK
jgi:hypothetical protein